MDDTTKCGWTHDCGTRLSGRPQRRSARSHSEHPNLSSTRLARDGRPRVVRGAVPGPHDLVQLDGIPVVSRPGAWWRPDVGSIAGACSAFLAIFMCKALLFVQHRHEIDDIEVTAKDQPRLFAFINRLADEAGAPRAHRVFLSPRVNAAVFYDLTVLNLLFPSRKNLEIGLGLVNAHARRVEGGAGARVRPFRAAHHGGGALGLHRATDRRAHHFQTRCARWVPARLVQVRSAHRLGGLAVVADHLVDPLDDGDRVSRRAARAASIVARDGAASGPGGGVSHRQRRVDPRAAQTGCRRRSVERAVTFADSEVREKRRVPDLFAVQAHHRQTARSARRSELR